MFPAPRPVAKAPIERETHCSVCNVVRVFTLALAKTTLEQATNALKSHVELAGVILSERGPERFRGPQRAMLFGAGSGVVNEESAFSLPAPAAHTTALQNPAAPE